MKKMVDDLLFLKEERRVGRIRSFPKTEVEFEGKYMSFPNSIDISLGKSHWWSIIYAAF